MFPKYDANSDYKAVIAHRGGAGLWPENMLYALDHVKTLGADWSEVDVRCSKDRVFVLMHVKTVNRADAFEIPGDYRGISVTVKPLVKAAHRQQK